MAAQLATHLPSHQIAPQIKVGKAFIEMIRHVIQTACTVAAPKRAQVTVLHAWDAVGEGLVWAFSSDVNSRVTADRYINEILHGRQQAMRRLLEAVDGDLPATKYPALEPSLICGAPETVIQEQRRALAADVVVMGTVARTGLIGVLIGNTAENIINKLECPFFCGQA